MKGSTYNQEKINWIQSVFVEHLGEGFKLHQGDNNLILSHSDGEVNLTFKGENDFFMMTSSNIPCTVWDATSEQWEDQNLNFLPLPGYEELTFPLINFDNNKCFFGFDFPGLVFWMLTRMEEINFERQDRHGRFKAVQSHAYLNNYLNRPIIDEWFYVLRKVIKKFWPKVELKTHNPIFFLSHDVDDPSRYGFSNILHFFKRIAGDFKKIHYPVSALSSYIYTKYKGDLHPGDPYNTFSWLMSVSESHNLKSTFYFISSLTKHHLDGRYDIRHKAIERLIKNISNRGHEIGLHPSYESIDKNYLIHDQNKNLLNLCDEKEVFQTKWSSRMHYLRWRHPDTLNALNSIGIDYECSLGYHDRVGFRCGTSHEFQGFDPISSLILNIRIRPLIVMDATLFNKEYMNLGQDKASIDIINKLKRRSDLYGGNFSLLWHNSTLCNNKKKNFYLELLLCLMNK
jgi:hypothetical protein